MMAIYVERTAQLLQSHMFVHLKTNYIIRVKYVTQSQNVLLCPPSSPEKCQNNIFSGDTAVIAFNTFRGTQLMQIWLVFGLTQITVT